MGDSPSQQVEAELVRLAVQPANLVELLAFDALYPDASYLCPIIALGSQWQNIHGDRICPYVFQSDAFDRKLSTCEIGTDSESHYLFLVTIPSQG